MEQPAHLQSGAATISQMRVGLALGATMLLVALFAASPSASASGGCPQGRGGTGGVEWGINGPEQLAAGFRSVHEGTPNRVMGLGGVRSVQAGFKFAVAVLSNCTAVSWGSNT